MSGMEYAPWDQQYRDHIRFRASIRQPYVLIVDEIRCPITYGLEILAEGIP